MNVNVQNFGKLTQGQFVQEWETLTLPRQPVHNFFPPRLAPPLQQTIKKYCHTPVKGNIPSKHTSYVLVHTRLAEKGARVELGARRAAHRTSSSPRLSFLPLCRQDDD